MLPAIFLDRDGVIIENRPNYVRSWDDVELLPHAVKAIARLSSSPFRLVIVTNQAGVGRGLRGHQGRTGWHDEADRGGIWQG